MRASDRLGRVTVIIRTVATVALAIVLSPAGTALASAPPPQSPPAGPPPGQTPPAPGPPPAGTPGAQPTGLSFMAEAGLALFTVKAEGAADFEAFFAKVKDALEKSTKPEYKQIASGWKIYKITDTLQPGQVLYASVMDPAAKGIDYDPVRILSDVSSAEVTALYPKFKDALISVNRLNLQPVMKMGGL